VVFACDHFPGAENGEKTGTHSDINLIPVNDQEIKHDTYIDRVGISIMIV